MRLRMRSELARDTADTFDIKQGVGGIADIEFLVQFLVLRDAARVPALLHWSDNIRQLQALADHECLSQADAAMLTDAYRQYRERLHHLRLAGAPGLVPAAELAVTWDAVTRLWARVFGAPGSG